MSASRLFDKFLLVVFYIVGLLCGIWLHSGFFANHKESYVKNVDHRNNLENLSEGYSPPPLLNAVIMPVEFSDSHKHSDDDSRARELKEKVKIFIWVMTTQNNHLSRVKAVKETWGKRCDKLLFMSDIEDKELPSMIINKEEGRNHLTAKTMKSFDYLYHNHLNEYDWFMKADDDTYLIVENLRYMLSAQDPNKPIFFGHHFRPGRNQGYASGGGGYVVSKEALRRFGQRNASQCREDGGAEDLQFGKCMEAVKVSVVDSRDSLNRTRFHCFNPAAHIDGLYPKWYLRYDVHNGTGKGEESISDYAITFHYVSPYDMRKMDFFLYHLRPYGILSGAQNLNRHN